MSYKQKRAAMPCRRTHAVIRGFCLVSCNTRNRSHCLDPQDPLDGKIGLVCQRTLESVSGELVWRGDSVRDQVLGSLVEE